jgi:CO dehydrogenase/acetyl-CoA synthase epsilon subunit
MRKKAEQEEKKVFKGQRKTSQEMNEEIYKFVDNFDQPIIPKTKSTSRLIGMKFNNNKFDDMDKS